MPLQKLQFRPGVNREGTTLANEGGWYAGDKIRFRSGQVEKIGGWVLDGGKVSTGGNILGSARSLWNWVALNGYNYVSVGTDQKFYLQNSPGGSFYDITPIRYVAPTGATTFASSLGSNIVTVTNATHGAQSGDWVTFTGVGSTGLGGDITQALLQIVTGYKVTYITANTYSIVVNIGSATLAGNISPTATTIPLIDISTSFPSPGIVTIGTEQIAYAARSGGYLTGCTRGYNTTTAVAHTLGDKVTCGAISSDSGNGGSTVVASYQITSGKPIFTVGHGWGAGGWSGVTTGSANTGWGQSNSGGLGVGQQLRLWSQANFGQNLIFNPRGGALYYWVVDAGSPNVIDVAQILSKTNSNTQGGVSYWLTDAYAPTVANYILVSDASRFVIAFGTDTYGDTVQNPMLVSWSDQESVKIWQPLVTNQAGNYTLSHGSYIVTAIQSRQEILVLTDIAIYSMQYVGTPYVWGFQLLANNISIIAQNAIATVNNVTYWMGNEKFYMYTGRVETLPCTLREYVYQDINMQQSGQIFAGTNEGFNEVWFFYPSAAATYIDRYVIYNYLERIWYYGNLSRTAWLDGAVRLAPMAMNYVVGDAYNTSNLIYHETGIDNGETNPPTAIDAFVQSSDFDIGDGHNFGFVWRIIPDLSFNGSTSAAPSLNFTVLPRQNPGTVYGTDDNPAVVSPLSYQTQHTYEVQQFTQYAYVRMRGRQMAFKIESNQLGVQWQLGVPRIDVKADGRR